MNPIACSRSTLPTVLPSNRRQHSRSDRLVGILVVSGTTGKLRLLTFRMTDAVNDRLALWAGGGYFRSVQVHNLPTCVRLRHYDCSSIEKPRPVVQIERCNRAIAEHLKTGVAPTITNLVSHLNPRHCLRHLRTAPDCVYAHRYDARTAAAGWSSPLLLCG